MIHQINIGDKEFSDIISGKRTFALTKTDREIAVGDLLALNECNEQDKHTGNSCLVYVDYITEEHPYVKEGCVAMSIKPCSVWRHDRPLNEMRVDKDYSVPYATGGK